MKRLSKLDDTKALALSKKIRAIKLLGGKCEICGVDNFIVLDFHHISDKKERTFSQLRNFRWSKILSEINQCQLLCGNCHREVHSKILGRGQKDKTTFMLSKKICQCSKCGYSGKDFSSLDFHHIDPKNKKFEISEAIHRIKTVSIKELNDELQKCVVLCKNCHRIEHFNQEWYEKIKPYVNKKIQYAKEIMPKIDRNVVKKMYNNGMRQIDIVNELGCSKGAISDIIKELKINNIIPS